MNLSTNPFALATTTDAKNERIVLVATRSTSTPVGDGTYALKAPTLDEVRQRATRTLKTGRQMTDREFTETFKRLINRGDIVRTGRGERATVTRRRF